MNSEEQDIVKKLQKWRIEEPSADLFESVVAGAVSNKQNVALSEKIEKFLENMFTSLEYGLSYKIAGLAVCALIGVAAGGGLHGGAQDDLLVQAENIVFGDDDWAEL